MDKNCKQNDKIDKLKNIFLRGENGLKQKMLYSETQVQTRNEMQKNKTKQ